MALFEQMCDQAERVERMAKRGLISADEAEQRINQIIDDGCPYYVTDHVMTVDEINESLENRRLMNRKKWKFLLDLTEKPVIV